MSPDKEKNDKHEITIIVNTVPKTIRAKEISYEEILRLEYGEEIPTGDDIFFNVKYWKGTEGKHEGSLTAGESVKVKEGMIFSVHRANRS